MSYPATAYSDQYHFDVARMLSSPNYFGPPPTVGSCWHSIFGGTFSGCGGHTRHTIGRYLLKRHGSHKEWSTLWRDPCFKDLDRRIPIEDPEKPRKRQQVQPPMNFERLRLMAEQENHEYAKGTGGVQ